MYGFPVFQAQVLFGFLPSPVGGYLDNKPTHPLFRLQPSLLTIRIPSKPGQPLFHFQPQTLFGLQAQPLCSAGVWYVSAMTPSQRKHRMCGQELKGDSKQAPASQNDSFVAAKAPAARPGVSPAPGKKGGKDLAKSEDLGQSNPEEEPEGLLVMAVPGNAMTGTYLKTQV